MKEEIGSKNLFPLVVLLIIAALVLIISSCGGGGGGTPPDVTLPDTTLPTVVSTSPSAGATGVAVNSALSITFSEAIDPATLTPAAIHLENVDGTPVPGTISSSGLTAVFTLSSPLAFSSSYTLIVSTAVKDLVGNPLAGAYSCTFTTGGALDLIPPAVVSTVPASGATNVAVNGPVSVTFSEAMDPTTLSAENIRLVASGGTTMPVTVQYNGLTAILTPASPLDFASSYTLIISPAVLDMAGNPLTGEHICAFATGNAPDLIPPTVILTTPSDASFDISVQSSISVTFSEAMASSSINTTTFTLTDGRKQVSGTVVSTGQIARFTPAVPMAHAKTYTATISQTVEDLAGNVMQSEKKISFTTETTVFAIQFGPLPQSLYTFETSAPNDLTLLGSDGFLPFYNFALGFNGDGQTLFAMDNLRNLGEIDKSTGNYRLLGSVSGILPNHNIEGLAVDPTTGTIYILSENGFTGSSALYTLSPVTLSTTLLGTQSNVRWLVELAFDLSDNLYTVSLDTNSLHRFNKLNGQVTLIGPLGQDIIGQQGMAFDQSTGVLYGIIGNRDLADYAFGFINMTTGAFTAKVITGDIRKIAIAPISVPAP